LKKPLIQHLLLHFRAAAPALPAFDLFVSQHRIALGSEINGGAFFYKPGPLSYIQIKKSCSHR
jgi:hypothetical protein